MDAYQQLPANTENALPRQAQVEMELSPEAEKLYVLKLLLRRSWKTRYTMALRPVEGLGNCHQSPGERRCSSA